MPCMPLRYNKAAFPSNGKAAFLNLSIASFCLHRKLAL